MNYSKEKRNKGITLIALVITIVVLLILVGVSISMLTGQNGILSKANDSKNRTEISTEKEGISLALITALMDENGYQNLNQETLQKAIDNHFGKGIAIATDNNNETFTVSFINSKRDYNINIDEISEGLNWNQIMSDAKAPQSQDEPRNNGFIAIGTDGKTVDLDNWNYTLYNGTYALNTLDVIEGKISNCGYIGEITSNGEIIGTIPTYIKGPNDNEFIAVTNLRGTFYNISDLKTAPKLPIYTEILRGTFSNCTGLIEAPIIPQTVQDMRLAFYKCTSLTIAPYIPSNVENIRATFSECINLITPPPIIPQSITNMIATFQNCKKLQGKIIINASVSGLNDIEDLDKVDYSDFFAFAATESPGLNVIGTCLRLEEIINTKTSKSNIFLTKT